MKQINYKCAECGYSQDFKPTKDKMNLSFNLDKLFPLNDVVESECPSCALKGIRGNKLRQE